jgi:GTPase SAR1 family protein
MDKNTNIQKPSIDQLLELRKYKTDHIPDKENVILRIGGKSVGSTQAYVIFGGLPKAGKSSFLNSCIASAFVPNDIFTMKINLPEQRQRLCLFDTESSDYDYYKRIQSILTFADLSKVPTNFDSFQVREDGTGTIRKMVERYLELNPDCSILVLDGLLDLITNYNDETESSMLTKWLKKITKVYDLLIISVLHFNKSNDHTTGVIGSHSDRFAQSTLEVKKDKENNTFVMQSRFMRSDADFEPITLMNFSGKFEQVTNDSVKRKGTKASDLNTLESQRLCKQIVTIPMLYSEIVDEIKERTAESNTYAKQLMKIWINSAYVVKDHNNKYKPR